MGASSSKLYKHQKPLRDIVGQQICEGIVTGELPPGTRLVERDLAQRYSVSRLPVREALRVLQHEGLAEHLPSRGMVVRTLDRTQVNELFDIREALEVLAIRQATIRIAEGASHRLDEFTAQAREAVAAKDVAQAHRANADFHDEIVAVAGNATLAAALEPLMTRLHWLLRQIPDVEHLCGEHEALCSGILAGDVEQATSAAQRHIASCRAFTLEFLFDEESGEPRTARPEHDGRPGHPCGAGAQATKAEQDGLPAPQEPTRGSEPNA